jgi:hypothetical protein
MGGDTAAPPPEWPATIMLTRNDGGPDTTWTGRHIPSHKGRKYANVLDARRRIRARHRQPDRVVVR